MRNLSAFIDEFGDTSINTEKSGVSSFFILTAVLLSSTDVNSARLEVEAIRKRFFQTGEMKSSTVGKDDEKRIKVLEAIKSLGFRTYSIVVDKRELSKESGLAYKKSFFKYINKLLYNRLYNSYDNVDIVADEHGYEEFMRGFEIYIKKNLSPHLFATRTFKFAPSIGEPLIQVADFISGTLARSLEPNKISPRASDLQKLVADFSIGIKLYPSRRLPKQLGTGHETTCEFDMLVRDHCIRLAEEFLEKTNREDEETRIQVAVLDYLLLVP